MLVKRRVPQETCHAPSNPDASRQAGMFCDEVDRLRYCSQEPHEGVLRLRYLGCRAVLFDLDGVLVDSRAVVERTWQRWTARHGLTIPDIVARSHGRRSVDTLRELVPEGAIDGEGAWLEATELSDTEGLLALPGAHDALHALDDRHRAIVTSGGRELAKMRLRFTGLPLPAVLVAAEDVRIGKPSPEGYAQAAARLGFHPGDCVVIEDTAAGISAGRAAGAAVIGVSTTFPPESLAAADRVIGTLADIRISTNDAGIVIE
jgi:mannitol-1-/sugar-/sorbitol-6-phosphatase